VRLNWLIGFQPCHYTISLVYRTYRILPGYLPSVDVGGSNVCGGGLTWIPAIGVVIGWQHCLWGL
jgi:hypothetical protein